MTFENFIDTYVMTLPTMLTITGIGLASSFALAWLNIARPISVSLDETSDPEAVKIAEDKVMTRRMMTVLTALLAMAGAIGAVIVVIEGIQTQHGANMGTIAITVALIVASLTLALLFLLARR